MKKIIIFLFFFFVTFLNVYAEGYVTNIKIDGKDLEGFSSDVLEYKINVDSSKSSIIVGYLYDQESYDAVGNIGTINLNYGENKINFTLTSKDNKDDTKTYTILVVRDDNRSSDNTLSSLSVGNNKVVLGNDEVYNVSIDAKETSVEVKATLSNSKASFVDGYGERVGNNALKLNSGTTTFEIKVKAENGNIRTYKINVNKVNALSNDATLKSLTIDKVEFEFKKDTYEYNLSVKSDVEKIKIKAEKNHEKASIDYKEEIELNAGVNDIEIKVTAEDSSVKVYKLKITKEEEKYLVKDIKIVGIDFNFDPKIYSYKIKTDLKKLDFDITLTSETAKSEVVDNEDLEDGNIVKINVTDNDDAVTYSFEIENNKEVVPNDDKKENTNDNKSDFLKDNEMIIGLIVLGIGVFSCLAAVLLKRKSKIM